METITYSFSDQSPSDPIAFEALCILQFCIKKYALKDIQNSLSITTSLEILKDGKPFDLYQHDMDLLYSTRDVDDLYQSRKRKKPHH
jgi:hypothetical protein